MPSPLPEGCDCVRFLDSGLTLHRLDKDLELCVCNKCGAGWVRDLGSWTRLQDAMDRLSESVLRVQTSTKSLEDALNKLTKASK